MFDAPAYLARIGYDGPTDPTVETLGALTLAHLQTVPFENLDIHANRPIQLEQAAVFAKIVGQRRGGFCYELNGLFAALLRSLGYRVDLLSAQFSRPDGDWSPAFDHLMLQVHIPGDEDARGWLTDVGGGRNSPTRPLRLGATAIQTDPWDGAAYRFTPEPGKGAVDAWLIHRRLPGEDWAPPLRIGTQPRRLSEFAAMCHWQQTAPESHFRQGRVCTRLTDDGRITLSEHTFILTRGGEREERALATEEDAQDVLRSRFGIDIAS